MVKSKKCTTVLVSQNQKQRIKFIHRIKGRIRIRRQIYMVSFYTLTIIYIYNWHSLKFFNDCNKHRKCDKYYWVLNYALIKHCKTKTKWTNKQIKQEFSEPRKRITTQYKASTMTNPVIIKRTEVSEGENKRIWQITIFINAYKKAKITVDIKDI